MKNSLSFTIFILLTFSSLNSFALADFATSEELRMKYPTIDDGSQRVEKKEILCPFWRLIERSGTLDTINQAKESDVIISIFNIAAKAKEFGCKWVECAAVATLVSAGQNTHPGTTNMMSVNISKLHKARGIAHDCGLTFEKGGTEVSDFRRSQTLARLKVFADQKQATLTHDDLMKVKLQTCEDEDVTMSAPGELEVGLIFNFLGGKDRGFIEYSDVVRFFHAKMPLTKSIDKI